MVRPYLGKDLCSEIKKATIYTYTQSPAQPQQPNELSNTFTLLLVVIIVIVSVETALVVYMALKVLRYRRASG
jgi:heme/copper-type cytochrome/quinol oxidase subunit 2